MKRLWNITGGLMRLLALLTLAVLLVRTFDPLGERSEPISQVFQSPIETPTTSPTATYLFPIPDNVSTPAPPSTFTPPPPPPTSTPTPTFTPAPPTPTPEPLPTLIPGLDTLVYATTGEDVLTGAKYPELYRAQVNEAGRMTPSIYRIAGVDDLPRGGWARTGISGLYPAPDGRHVAVEWAHGTGESISILEVNSGRFSPLFPEGGSRIRFLDWTPDGRGVLVLKIDEVYEPGEGVRLVDIQAHTDLVVDVKGDPLDTNSASFSPDGKEIVYAQILNSGSEIWRIALDGSVRQRLYDVSDFRVEDVRWSPDSNYIAFTQSPGSKIGDPPYGVAIGELWIMGADGQDRRLLSPALVGSEDRFTPVWSPDGRCLAFVRNATATLNEEMTVIPGNIYLAEVASVSVSKMTDFEAVEVQKPVWSSDGSEIAFSASETAASELFELRGIIVDSGELYPLSDDADLVIRSDRNSPLIVLLPTSK